MTALRTGGLDAFKGRFRRADVLLIDDVQFLESKAKTEEEFFHTFNALHEAGSQLVLTSDRLPRDLGALEDRLRERFEAGLVADIGAPDRAMRLAVLRKRVQHDGVAARRPRGARPSSPTASPTTSAPSRARSSGSSPSTRSPAARSTRRSRAEVLDGLYPTPLARISSRRHPRSSSSSSHVRGLRHHARGARLAASAPARVAWPRQVAMYLCARAHRPEPPCHRPALRRAQPHHGHARVPRAPSARTGRRRRTRSRLCAASPRVCTALRDDRSALPHCARACAQARCVISPLPAAPVRVAHTCTSPMTSSLSRRDPR